VLVVTALAVAGLYAVVRQVAPSLLPASTFCEVRAGRADIPLTAGQAGIASTIAGVARHRDMPGRAVTVAYAAALQESKLTNLRYGDLDSVGIFQQRPSQGWGPARQLENPVLATAKFFAALAAVPGYLHLPIYQAAQAVQRSADGYAYQQYAPMAADLASAFTGRSPHAVWCSFAGPAGKTRLRAAIRQLTGAFGPIPVRAARDPSVQVRVRGDADGWAVAAWLVSHASGYGIREIRYQDYRWTFGRGARGWIRERAADRPAAPAGVIAIG
jgi:hypothetical protein